MNEAVYTNTLVFKDSLKNKFEKIMDYNWILLKSMRYYMETIKIQHLFGRFSIFFLVLIVVVFILKTFLFVVKLLLFFF